MEVEYRYLTYKVPELSLWTTVIYEIDVPVLLYKSRDCFVAGGDLSQIPVMSRNCYSFRSRQPTTVSVSVNLFHRVDSLFLETSWSLQHAACDWFTNSLLEIRPSGVIIPGVATLLKTIRGAHDFNKSKQRCIPISNIK
ncbi:hypothetical protein TNCV_1992081 [Trichonephila clavipes]|nr:hypothetical protein TNCV_1992081 [Trichonephila clavipes]